MEQSVQPPMTTQVNRIIEVETYNIYSVNKVLLQQILETIFPPSRRRGFEADIFLKKDAGRTIWICIVEHTVGTPNLMAG